MEGIVVSGPSEGLGTAFPSAVPLSSSAVVTESDRERLERADNDGSGVLMVRALKRSVIASRDGTFL
jgi:hypothetical protein